MSIDVEGTTPAGGIASDRRPARLRRARSALGMLALATVAAALAAIAHGAIFISPLEILRAVPAAMGLTSQGIDPLTASVLFQIRLPRVALALAVGAGLGISGAVLQGLFRNPLADPGLIGVSSGAGLAAVATIVLGGSLPGLAGIFALPLAAFLGGMVTTVVVYNVVGERGGAATAMLLLAGIAVNAMASAGMGILTYISDDSQLRELTFWLMGSVGGATWAVAAPASFLIALAICLLLPIAGPLNVYLLGEAEARHLGIDVRRLKRTAILATALAVGAAVAVSGIIGFIGLVVPHLVRLIAGPDHRFVLPGAGLLGATLLCGADILARTLVVPAELPIGLVTSLVGGPFFLWLLLRRRADGGS
ncbi:MAG TPA: iron ABC transporter permease [Alphaproteobacteria bacterium]|nr:iron ABC transporter permease [Alphaproteobacteria bacterium]